MARAPRDHSQPAIEARYSRMFWLLVVGATGLRLAFAGTAGLSTDESHYALYARHLAWGYFDHPPMVGFLGALTTFGTASVFLYRLGPILCAFLSACLLRRLALDLFQSEKVAFLSVLLLAVMPVHHLLAMSLLPDATLNVFWCAALIAAWRAFRNGRWRDWIVTGVLCGGALMSKYQGALLPICLLGYAVTGRKTRRWLLNVKPYVAGVVGLLIFLPNLLWNYRHNWISYAYQLRHGGGSGQFTAGKLLGVVGGQLASGSPIIGVLFMVAAVTALLRRPIPDARRFAVWGSVSVFLFFCGLGLFGKILPHWTAVGWWAGVVLLADTVAERTAAGGKTGARWRRWAWAGGTVGASMILLIHVAIAYPIVGPLYDQARQLSISLNARLPSIPAMQPFRSEIDLTNDLYGWDQAARCVERIRRSMPDPSATFVLGNRFYTVSQLGVYLSRETYLGALDSKPNQYRLWFDPAAHIGWDAVFADDARWPLARERYETLFARVDEKPVHLEVTRRGTLAHVFEAYRCYGFKGSIWVSSP